MKKFLALSLVAAMMALLVIPASASTKAAVKAAKTLTIGVDNTYPPMEFQKGSKTVGFDMEMTTAVAKKMGMTVKFVPIAWDGIFTGLKAKKFDCIVSSVSITPDRLKNLAFTKPYIANAQMIVVKKGAKNITKISQLKGLNVGVQLGTTADDSATTIIKKKKISMNVTKYDQIIQCFQAMDANRISAIIVDEVVGEYYIAKNPSKYAAASLKLTNEPIGACFRKSDTKLRDKFQKALNAVKANGTLKKISMKWFGKDLTSNINSKLKTLS